MKQIITVFILLVTAIPVFAIQENKKINLQDAIELTLKTNPQIKIKDLDIEIAKNDIKKANRLQNPDVVFYQNIPKAGLGNPQTLGLDYTIEILKRDKRKNYAKIYSNIALDNKDFIKYNLICEVKKSYINLLIKKTHLKILTEQKNLAKQLYDTIEAESKKGSVPENEAIQAKIDLNRTVMYTNIAKSEVISAQNYFNTVLNTSNINYDTKEDSLSNDYNSLFSIAPDSKFYSFNEIKDIALKNRLDILMAKKETEAKKINLEIVKSQKIPDIQLTGGYAYQTKGMSENGHFQSGGYIGASLVNLPLFYKFKPEIQNAELEIKKAELKYKDTEIDAIRNVDDAYEKFITAKNNLNFYNEKLLLDSKDLMKISAKNLSDKKIDITTFLVTKKLYLELILGYFETLGEYYISYAELLRELNVENL